MKCGHDGCPREAEFKLTVANLDMTDCAEMTLCDYHHLRAIDSGWARIWSTLLRPVYAFNTDRFVARLRQAIA